MLILQGFFLLSYVRRHKRTALFLLQNEFNQEHYQRGFAPKGQPPAIDICSKPERLNMISAITNRGSLKFMIYDEKMTQQLFIEFLERLVADSTRKVFLIVDNLRVHHGKIVKEWLSTHQSELELFFIPPYSLNLILTNT